MKQSPSIPVKAKRAKTKEAGTVRRTQEERSAATQEKLLLATIEVLHDRGYHGTTACEVASRAGVSRGAQLHHFPTKEDLVVRAVEYVFEKRTAEYRAAFAALPQGLNRGSASVELLWSMFKTPLYYAWLELVVAARTDAALRRKVSSLGQRFGEIIRTTHHENFGTPHVPNPVFELGPFFTFALMEGLALDKILGGDQPHIEGSIELLKHLAAFTLPKS